MTVPRVIAVGSSPIGETALPGRDLFSVALTEAFESLPTPSSFIDALYVGNQSESYENQIMLGTILAEWAGLRELPAIRVEGCAAAGGLAFNQAVTDVATGTHDAVLACGVEKMTARGTTDTINALAAAFDRPLEQRSGVTAPSQYALLAQRYLHETSATEVDLARIAVKNHENACANPRAQFSGEISIDTVLDSDYIAPPLKLFDCAPVSDGAAVAVVVSPEVANEIVPDAPPVAVTGSAVVSNNIGVAERNLTRITGAETACSRGYDDAGITPSDIDVAEVHDAFTISEALLTEASGISPGGLGWEIGKSSDSRSAGWEVAAVNTSGGLKARGHPIGATGILQIIELYEQLTNTAGARQVPDASCGLAINEGGIADSITTTHVLEGAA